MRICKDCTKSLPIDSFQKAISNKDGYDLRCKECRKDRYFNVNNPVRVFKRIYYDQKNHSNRRKHQKPAYTFDQLINWADKQPNLLNIWDNWVNSNFQKNLRPSVDRLDDNKPYTLCNIQLTTWQENNKKGYASRRKQAV